MGTLSQEQMGNAAGIFNLMRNVGGSIGIAMITTLVTRNAQVSQAALAPHMSQFNFNFQQQIAHIQNALANTTGNWDAIKKIARRPLQHPATTELATQLCPRFPFLRPGLPGLCGARFFLQEGRQTGWTHRGALKTS